MEKIDMKNVSHVLLNNGWIPVDEGTFIESYREGDSYILLNKKECVLFKSEGKLILCPFDSIIAVKFNK